MPHAQFITTIIRKSYHRQVIITITLEVLKVSELFTLYLLLTHLTPHALGVTLPTLHLTPHAYPFDTPCSRCHFPIVHDSFFPPIKRGRSIYSLFILPHVPLPIVIINLKWSSASTLISPIGITTSRFQVVSQSFRYSFIFSYF